MIEVNSNRNLFEPGSGTGRFLAMAQRLKESNHP